MARNPFNLADVPDPIGADVEAFAGALAALDREIAPEADENAIAWVAIATNATSIDGAWSGRWRDRESNWNGGVATVHVDGDRVYILYKDAGRYLIEAEVRGDRWVGRYVNVDRPSDTSPWVGVVISPYRIDGFWKQGRWDFRRASPDEQPEPIVAAVLTEARKLPVAQLRELLGFARYLRWRGDKPSSDEP